MASVWQSVCGRSAVVVMAAALSLAACSPRPAEDQAAADAKAASESSHSALGDYLAARLATAAGDSKAAAEYYGRALNYDPDDLELMQRAFTLMVAEGKLDEAMPLAERLVALDSDSPMPLLVLGVREARAGHFAQAGTRFAALPKRGVNGFLGPLLTAWAEEGQGRTDKALAALAPLAQTAGLKPLQAFHAALINDLADRAQPAEEQYQAALAGGPLNIRAVEAAGSLWQRTGHADRAKALYDRYHGEHPDTMLFDGARLLQAGTGVPRAVANPNQGLAEAMFDIATLMRQGNAMDFAMVFSRLAVALEPDFPLAQMTIADILTAHGRLAEANAIYRGISPASPVATFGRLRVAANLDDMGDGDGALAELAKLAKERPDSVDALITMGDVQRRHKNYAAAAKSYGEAISRLPADRAEYWVLYYSRGIAYERAGQWPQAESDLSKALRLEPDQPDVLNYLGYSWIDKGENLPQARAMIEKAVSLRPNDGAIVDSLGWALYRLGSYPESVKLLERAVELKGEDPTINEHLGDAYWRVGRRSEAHDQWQRALGLDPEPEMVDALKEKLHTGQLP
jgi:tetratricopeptide (TPR) repeat protein